MSMARLNAIAAVTNYRATAPALDFSKTPAREIFGSNVFDDRIMKARLPATAYQALRRTIDRGTKLDVSVATEVAKAMRDWAIEKGATHYAHVFYPLTGLTAEKHDSFLEPDGHGGALAEFSAHCVTIGQDVKLVRGDEVQFAHADGIDGEAALRVTYPDGTAGVIASGEVSVRGMYGYT